MSPRWPQSFGGGGHECASGCAIEGPLSVATERMLAQLRIRGYDVQGAIAIALENFQLERHDKHYARPHPPLDRPLALIAFCGFLFFAGLQVIGLVGADEPRYAQVAREMLPRHDWVTPVLCGQPWLEKPPLLLLGRRCSPTKRPAA